MARRRGETAPSPADPLSGFPVLMTVEQAASVLGWSPATGHRKAAAGDHPACVRMGRRWYIRREQLRRWLVGQEDSPAEPDVPAPERRLRAV